MIIDMVNKLVDDTLKEDIGMAKKKDRFTQMDIGVVNAVKEEVLNGVNETATGFESLDEIIEDEDMIQREMKNDEIWDKGSKHGEVESDQIPKNDFNDQRSELEKKKEELATRMMNMPTLSNKVKKDENSGIWSIPNCQPIYRNGSIYKWITTLNCYQLNEMYSSKIPSIIYDSSIQRGSRITAKGEEKPLIYTANVKTILSKMLDNSMDAGQVLLNYAKEYPESLNFNEDDNTLSGQNHLAICDSAHRLESMKIWCKRFKKDPLSIKDPREFYMPVFIFNLDHLGAENLFVEANSKGKAVSRTRLAFHDVFNENRKIVDIVANQSLLKGKIELVSGTISKSSNKIITYKTLLDNVAQFKALNPKEAEEIGLYLVEFWNELISNIFPEAMGNIDIEAKARQKKQSFILENMHIAGFFTVANKLRGINDWKTKLKKLADNDFLSRSNPTWGFCLREGDKIINSSKVSKKIGEIMAEYVMS